VAVIVKGVSAAKLVDDKLRVVVVGFALQKASGEVTRMNNRQIKMTTRDPVLDMAGHTRSRAKAHDVDQVRENERILRRLGPIARGVATGSPIEEPEGH
jgi:hypothetical protein